MKKVCYVQIPLQSFFISGESAEENMKYASLNQD